jgi:plasmid stabilization system protein ParE
VKISHRDFGIEAAARYRDLIETAIRDILHEPKRPGAKIVSTEIRTYHIALSKIAFLDRKCGIRAMSLSIGRWQRVSKFYVSSTIPGSSLAHYPQNTFPAN